MGKKPSTIAAFEVGPSRLKFVEMPRNERRVLSAGVFSLAPGRWRDRAHLAAQIRSALDTTALGKVERLVASAPLAHAHLRVVEVPPGADARDHLLWDMSRYLARPPEAYAFDFQPENTVTAAGEARRYTVAAFRRDEAIALRDTLEHAAGVPLAALDVDAAAVINAFSSAYPEFLNDRAVILNANIEGTAVLRARHGGFHGASLRRDAGDSLRPSAETQERAEGLLRLARGIAESLRAGEDAWSRPEHIFLCGDLSTDEDFQELLRSLLPEGFNLLNPFRNLPGPDPADCPDPYPGAPLTAATGLALRLAGEG